MRPMSLREFAALAGGHVAHADSNLSITGFATDSRDVRPGDLFLAIRGAQVDGHDFVPRALAQGAVAALVERATAGPSIVVPHLVQALASFAHARRIPFHGPVVGITGSNGKTSAKEFTAAALSPLGPILKSPGNRNTEYTAPLLWASLDPSTQAVVAELAMRGHGQIAHLAGFTQPTIGVITMIGTAHLEMVGSREGIAAAKGELLDALTPDGAAVLWHEDDFLETLTARSPARVYTFGTSPDATCRLVGYRSEGWARSVVRGHLDGQTWEAILPTVGRFQALNAAASVLVAWLAGVEPVLAAGHLAQATLPPMRMEVRAWHGCTVVVDTYNASPDSTSAALLTLAEAPSPGPRWAVLGEMKELGDFSESGHRRVGRAVAETLPDRVILMGEPTAWVAEEALSRGYPAEQVSRATNLDEVRSWLDGAPEGATVLIKGSRALGLESVLEPPPTSTRGEVRHG